MFYALVYSLFAIMKFHGISLTNLLTSWYHIVFFRLFLLARLTYAHGQSDSKRMGWVCTSQGLRFMDLSGEWVCQTCLCWAFNFMYNINLYFLFAFDFCFYAEIFHGLRIMDLNGKRAFRVVRCIILINILHMYFIFLFLC